MGLNVKLKIDESKFSPMMTVKWEEKVLKCHKCKVRLSRWVPHVSNVSMTQSTGTKAKPIFYLYTVLNPHVLIYCTGHNFSHGLVKLLIFLDDGDSVGDSDVDFQSSEEDNHDDDDDDEVAVGGEGDVHQEMDPSSENLSVANQSEPESGQHYA